MKKSIILLACVLGAFSAKAQTVIESTKFTDNWSVGINAGAVTCVVTTDKSGEKNMPKPNKTATTNAVKPVRPPTAIPAEDST